MNKPVMTVNVKIDRTQISDLESPIGKVRMIPFYGNVESELFNGEILPGACDVQVTNSGGIKHMLAQYMFEGTDCKGEKCHVFVKNDGFFEPGSSPSPFKTCPVLMTDSKELMPYLSQARFRGEGQSNEEGVTIKIFDVMND